MTSYQQYSASSFAGLGFSFFSFALGYFSALSYSLYRCNGGYNNNNNYSMSSIIRTGR